MKSKNTQKKKNRMYHVGNVFIILSVVIFLYIYLPLISVYIFPKKLSDLSYKNGYFIQIPKISAEAPIIENVNPWNEKEYLKAIHNGVAEAQGSVKPTETGTLYFFAHSSDAPWNITQYNTAFFRLGELKKGDVIKLFKSKNIFSYQVYQVKEVWADDVGAIKDELIQRKNYRIILQTCTPIGTSLKRLLIFAERV